MMMLKFRLSSSIGILCLLTLLQFPGTSAKATTINLDYGPNATDWATGAIVPGGTNIQYSITNLRNVSIRFEARRVSDNAVISVSGTVAPYVPPAAPQAGTVTVPESYRCNHKLYAVKVGKTAKGQPMDQDESVYIGYNPCDGSIPTLSEWGMLLFAAALAGMLGFFIIRRRASSRIAAN